jgi:peptide/nickel transport system substrate-binding protein
MAVRIYPSEEPNSFDPFATDRSSQAALMHLVYSGLTRRDASGTVLADLAREVPTTANGGIRRGGLDLVFRLRADARFSSGEAVTADDVVASWRFARDRHVLGRARLGWLDLIDEVRAVDRRTVSVGLTRPVRWAVGEVMPFVLPARSLGGDPLNLPLWRSPVGSGPYELAEWIPRQRMRFEANDSYHGPRPSITQLEARFFATEASRVAAFVTNTGPSVIEWLSQDDAKTATAGPDVTLFEGPSDSWSGFVVTTDGPRTREPAVRRALMLALPARAIIHSYAGQLGATGRATPASWSTGATLAVPKEDTRAAAAVLDRAGFEKGELGDLFRDGERLDVRAAGFRLPTDGGNEELIGQFDLMQESFRSIGVVLKRAVQDAPVVYAGAHLSGSAAAGTHYDFLYASFPSPREPFSAWPFDAHDIPTLDEPMALNVARISDDAVQRAALEGALAASESARSRRFRQAAARLVGTRSIIVDVAGRKLVAVRGLEGVRPSDGPWGDYWNVEEWRVAP